FGSSAVLGRFVGGLPLRGKSFLDLGCGSGIIGLCAARAGAQVTAVDINPAAVQCAAENAARAGLPVVVRYSDLFSAVPERFDVIAWNPPFLLGVPRNTAESAFFGGDRYEVIERFASEAPLHLNDGGKIYSIISTDADIDRIQSLFAAQGLSSRNVASE